MTCPIQLSDTDSPMMRRAPTHCLSLLLFFMLCQVIGTMCALPDLSIATEAVTLVEDSMVCPMDGTIMCPPSLTSSPERQMKSGEAVDLDRTPIVAGLPVIHGAPSVPSAWSWSSAFSIVPISIASSSVLRI
ncbi:hypothetical protein NITMOv2_1928 [Nitrospira moscoviensis]|uniref:Uncharacterized protein n=1 Tax=Nitrospira moscoviensis TaxID=42253 RepID=A0A0K2GCM5_NITMO|nr:hypothetical protein NITMOv2_1928 [Nitrospira moscoviensis]